MTNREYVKQWREKNKDRVSAYSKRYYEEHREERLAYAKQYQRDHTEKIKEYHRRWYEKNRDKICEQKHRTAPARILSNDFDDMILPFTDAQGEEQQEFVESYVRRHGIW